LTGGWTGIKGKERDKRAGDSIQKELTASPIGPGDKKRLLETLDKDLSFLAKMNLTNYSLSIGWRKSRGMGGGSGRSFEEPEEEGGSVVPTPPESPTGGRKSARQDSGEGGGAGTGKGLVVDSHRDYYAIPATTNDKLYFFGIVDVLRSDGIRKQVGKSLASKSKKGEEPNSEGGGAGKEAPPTDHVNEEKEKSGVSPELYAKRLHDFLSKTLECING
jgi:hypothetical protein